MPQPTTVGQNIDTFIGYARVNGDFPYELAAHLEELKRQSQEAEEDPPTPRQSAGEVLFIKPHGAGRQWRRILHSPSIHVDVGLGGLTYIVAKARLSSAFLWEHEIGTALTLLYGFLAEFLQYPFTLQVSEVHRCADVAGCELGLDGVSSFITRSRSKGLRLYPSELQQADDKEAHISSSDMRLQFAGRRLATLDFSKGAPHACCLYDETAETIVSRKDWMQEVWASNGWDGESRVTRVEFWYKRKCLREMGSKRPTPSSTNSLLCGRTPPSSSCGTQSPMATRTVLGSLFRLSGSSCSRPASSATVYRRYENDTGPVI